MKKASITAVTNLSVIPSKALAAMLAKAGLRIVHKPANLKNLQNRKSLIPATERLHSSSGK